MKHLYALVAFTVLLFPIGSRAQVFEENFNYGGSAGTLVSASSSAWVNFSGTTTADYTPTGLTFAGYAGSGIGGAATITGARSEDVYRDLGTSYTSGSVYYAFLMRVTSAFTGSGSGLHFTGFLPDNSTSNFVSRFVINAPTTGGATYQVAIKRSAGGSPAESPDVSAFSANLNVNQTYLIVIKYTFVTGAQNDRLDVFILDSSVPGTEPGSPTLTHTPTGGNEATNISRVYLRQTSSIGDITIDGMRIGTTWADVVAASAGPAIQANASFATFATPVNTISAEQSYTVSGSNLTNDITVTAPTSFEVSTTPGMNFGSSVTLNQSSGTVAPTTVYVRLNPGMTPGPYSGNITHASTGASSVNVAVSGVNETPLSTLAQVRANQNTLLTNNEVVRVRGRVINTNFNPAQIVIQDNSGPGGEPRGISVFVGDENYLDNSDRAYFSGLSISEGDSVEVEGPIGEFEGFPEDGPTTGVLQIQGTPGGTVRVTKLMEMGAVAPYSTTLAALDEDLESTLVQISNVTFSQADPDFAPGFFRGETTYSIGDGVTSNFDLRLDISTDITRQQVNGDDYFRATSIPTGAITLTGVAGHFSSTRQIIPRSVADVGNPSTTSYLNASNLASTDTDILKIVTWNLLWFGDPDVNNNNPRSSTEAEQRDFIAQIIFDNGWDVIAVQEVMETSDLDGLVSRLNTLAGSTVYAGSHFSRGASLQDLGFIYRTDRISSPAFAQVTAGLTSADWASGRFPVQLTFTFGGESFTLYNIHLKAGDTSADRTQRVNALAQLKTIADGVAGNVVVLGDFNDRTDVSISGGSSPIQPYVDDNTNYTGVTEGFAGLGLPTNLNSSRNSAIDHIFVSSELADNSIFGTTFPFYGEQFDNYRGTTTDHYPVVTYLAMGTVTDNDRAIAQGEFRLGAYPNPARSQSTLTFNLLQADEVTLALYNSQGQRVALPLDGAQLQAGEQRVTIDVSGFAPGLYYVRGLFRRSGATGIVKLVVTR